MNIRLSADSFIGPVRVPSSKSASHRAVIAASVAKGQSRIYGANLCDDVIATIDAVNKLGGNIYIDNNILTVKGIEDPAESAVIDCRESGSTVRFMIPLAAAYGVSAEFTGSGRLPYRPLAGITDALSRHGISFTKSGTAELPLRMSGVLDGKPVDIAGNVSSQYLTGLLLASSVNGGRIRLTTALGSSPYVDMTADMLRYFGADVSVTGNEYTISGRLSARDIAVEGDWSAAAFFFEAAAFGGSIRLSGLDPDSRQADKACIEIFGKMGVTADHSDGVYTLSRSGRLSPAEMDASQCPDLVPAVAAAMGFADGDSVIYNAGRLRIKESDRLKAVSEGLGALGIKTEVNGDRLVIHGGKGHGGTVDSYGDHRIAMAFSMASGAVSEDITIIGAECVSKSYPQFYEAFKSIGGKADVINYR